VSLVVAEATDDGPRIVSDTRVLFPEGPRSSFKTGTLKAIVVARDVTICFAGDVIAGLEGVRGFARGLGEGHSVDDLLPALQEFSSAKRRIVEFIVATGERSSQLRLIHSGVVERALPFAWIGDQLAFERFQRERNRPRDFVWSLVETSDLPPATRIMTTLIRAMRATIEDPAIESVADFCIPVAFTPRGFEYLGSVFIYVGRDIHVRPGEDLIARMLQPAEEGGYAVSVVEPAEPGTPALGLNFPRARLGMVYLPLEFDGAQVIWDVSPDDFAKVVLDRFGVAMKNPPLQHR
jgi:hypothetical protein